jgi:putative flippase GtrA
MTAFISSRGARRQLVTYAAIGIIVASVDFSLFNVLIGQHAARFVATTAAYATGVLTHFLLNRFFNFRNFERTIVQQARTYTVIIAFAWVVTLLIVELGVRLGFAAFPSRVAAAILNFPLGFACHRYLTFGAGITATVRDRLSKQRQ